MRRRRLILVGGIGVVLACLALLRLMRTNAPRPRVSLHGIALGDSLDQVKRVFPAAQMNDVMPNEFECPTSQPPGWISFVVAGRHVIEISWRGEMAEMEASRFAESIAPHPAGSSHEFVFSNGPRIEHASLWKSDRHMEWIYVVPTAVGSSTAKVSHGVKYNDAAAKIDNYEYTLR